MWKRRSEKRRFLRFALPAAGGWLLYSIAIRNRPGPLIPPEDAESRLMIIGPDPLGSLGETLSGILEKSVRNRDRAEALERLNLTLLLESSDESESPLALTFSDGYVIMEHGRVEQPELHLLGAGVDLSRAMDIFCRGLSGARMGRRELEDLMLKVLRGELRFKGWGKHPVALVFLRRLLYVGAGSEGERSLRGDGRV